jgi:hypothetical protein
LRFLVFDEAVLLSRKNNAYSLRDLMAVFVQFDIVTNEHLAPLCELGMWPEKEKDRHIDEIDTFSLLASDGLATRLRVGNSMQKSVTVN